jgi:hypothetical protein
MAISTEIGASVAVAGVGAHGHTLEVRKPRECMEALEMLAAGCTRGEVVRATGLTYSAVAALRMRHDDAIDVRRLRAAEEAEELADTFREVLRQKGEALLSDPEAMRKLNPKDAALTLGILTDKGLVLRGDATSIVEHKKGVSLEDVMQMKEAAMKRIKGEAIDV